MNVIKFDRSKKKDAEKKHLLELVDSLRTLIENDAVDELVAVTVNNHGNLNLYVSTADLLGAVGCLELGKNILMNEDLG